MIMSREEYVDFRGRCTSNYAWTPPSVILALENEQSCSVVEISVGCLELRSSPD